MRKKLKKATENGTKFDLYNNDDFIHKIISKNAMACNNINNTDFDIKKLMLESREALNRIGVQNPVQAMLASQMLTIHNLQQDVAALAKATRHPENQKYYHNAVVKLSNTFTQQATLLSKLQGHSNQKMVVEHVNVHEGGQAIVGNVQGSPKRSD